MYCMYRRGERQDPWGTPASIFLIDDWMSEIFILNFRLNRNDFTILIKCIGILVIVCSLWIRPLCQTLSNAFSMSRKIAAVCLVLLVLQTSSSISLVS